MKKGFVFLETLLVMVVLSIAVLGVYSTYVSVTSNIDSRTYYDNIGDLYKTEIVRNWIDENNLITSENYIKITSSNCSSYMSITNCSDYMDYLQIENIYINNSNIVTLLELNDSRLSNSLKLYIKTMNNDNKRYIIVNYKRNNKNYYSSLRI